MEIITFFIVLFWFVNVMADRFPIQTREFLSKLIDLVPSKIDRKVFAFTVLTGLGFILLLALCFRQ
jgi:hypothetical protein